MLDRVTITGADDKTDIAEMMKVSRDFPFVEWGILFSKSKKGSSRFPSKEEWFAELIFETAGEDIKLSAHICGKWVRDIVEGKWTIIKSTGKSLGSFQRIQLNFGPYINKANLDDFFAGFEVRGFASIGCYPQIIFQVHNFHESVINHTNNAPYVYDVLLDRSGGRGLEISTHGQNPPEYVYCGYAGGLNCDNVVRILEAFTLYHTSLLDKFWIDIESGVRTNNELDLSKVRRFLELCAPFVR